MCFLMTNIIASDPLNYDNKYAGRYFYYNSNGYLFYFTICNIGYYMISFYYQSDGFESPVEHGYHETTDSIITFVSLIDSGLFKLKIIDTLNLEILFSRSNFFTVGEFIHRISAFPPYKDDSCFYNSSSCISSWEILYDYKKPHPFRVEYRKFSHTSEGVDLYELDYNIYLPDTIYKYKEGQYRKY